MKITVSGWPATGGTSLAVLLSKTLNFKLLQGGEVFRYIYRELSFKDKGKSRMEGHNLIEPYFGPLFDEYIDSLILDKNINNILIESDITAFRVGKRKDLFSIFLIASDKKRIERTSIDKRNSEGENLKKIDADHAKIYNELHGINFLNVDEIESKHSLVMDNTNLSISDELNIVYKNLKDLGLLSKNQLEELLINSKAHADHYWKVGKEGIINELIKSGNYYTTEEILKDISKRFKSTILKFPKELQTVINK